MDDILQQAIAALLRWPVKRQEEVAEFILALDRLHGPKTPPYHLLAETPRRDADAALPLRLRPFPEEGARGRSRERD